MASIIVSRIPENTVRDDVIELLRDSQGSDALDYVLFPLGRDSSKALVAFKSKQAAEEFVRHPQQLFGQKLKLRSAPRQTYERIQADVDALLVATLPDLDLCIQQLKSDFGVKVAYSDERGTLTLAGSLLQIQCAQTHLDHVFLEQQEAQARELMMMEQDLETPRSQRSMVSDQSGGFEEELMQKLRTKEGAWRQGDAGPSGAGVVKASEQVVTETRPVREPSGRTSAQTQARREEYRAAGLPLPLSGAAGDAVSQGLSTMPNRKTEAAVESTPLLHTAPAQAWPEKREGTVPPDGPSLDLELDLHVMSYIRKIHKAEVQGMERKHDCVFFFKSSKDAMKTRILSNLSDEDGAYLRLDEVKEEFVAFYQTVFYSVVKETVTYDEAAISQSDIEAVVLAVSKAFASRVFINDKTRGSIVLVGQWEFVSLVLDWIQKKLGLKPETEMAATLPERAWSNDVTEVKKPSSSLVGGATWSGQPSRSGSGPKAHGESTASRIQRSSDAVSAGAYGPSPYDDVADMVVRGRPAPRTSVDSSLGSYRSELTRAPVVREQVMWEFTTEDGVHVTIMKADITRVKADVIVNASNETLHHIGNVAAAINMAAGRGFQEECSKYVALNGPLKVSQVMSTKGQGRLLCEHVIHAVGPMWSLYDNKERCAKNLRRTFLNALYYANNKLKARSIVLPAIGTGIYGVPLDVCARCMHEAVESFSPAASTLTDVMFVTLEEEGAGMIAVIFQQLQDLKKDASQQPDDESKPVLQEPTAQQLTDPSLAEQEAPRTPESVTEAKSLLSGVDLEQTGQHDFGRLSGGDGDLIRAAKNEEQFASAPPVRAVHAQEQYSSTSQEQAVNQHSSAPAVLKDQVGEQYSSAPPVLQDDPVQQYSHGSTTVTAVQSEEQYSSAPAVTPAWIEEQRAEGTIRGTEELQDLDEYDDAKSPFRRAGDSDESSENDSVPFQIQPVKVQDKHAASKSDDEGPASPPPSPVDDVMRYQQAVKADDIAEMFASVPKTAAGELQSGTQSPRSEIAVRQDEEEDERSGAYTPATGQQLPGSGLQSPRSFQASPRSVASRTENQTPTSEIIASREEQPGLKSGQETPTAAQVTARSGTESPGTERKTPRSGVQTPRSGVQTPRSGAQTPRSGEQTPRSGVQTPRSGVQTPRSGVQTPRSAVQTPRSAVQTTRSGAQTPRSGVQTPRSGVQTQGSAVQTPRSGAQTPRSGVQTPRSEAQTPQSRSPAPEAVGHLAGHAAEMEELDTLLHGSGEGTEAQLQHSGDQTPLRTRPESGTRTPRSGDLTPVRRSLHSESPAQVSGQVTPKSGVVTPKSGASGTPKLEVQSPRSGIQTPRSLVQTPRSDVQNMSSVEVTPTQSPRSQPGDTVTNIVVPATSQEVQSSAVPLEDTESGETPLGNATGPRESIPEEEAQLLDAVFNQQRKTSDRHPRISIDSVSDTAAPLDQQDARRVPLLIRLVSHSVCIAARAGDIIRSVSQQQELGIVEKEAAELQTEADRCAQLCIEGSLQRLFPDLTVIGEEGDVPSTDLDPKWIETSQSADVLQYVREVPDDYRDISLDDVVVWVDPLDGTSDFVSGNLEACTVLIGIAVKGKAVAGVIHQPFYENGPADLGRTVWGVQGMGVFGIDLDLAPKGQNIVLTSRRKHDLIDEALQACDPTDVLFVGGSGNKALMMLEGKAHAVVYPLYGFMKWDTCTIEAVLHAAGGELTDCHGNSYRYSRDVEHDNRGGILATSVKEDHEVLLRKLPESVLEQIPTDGPAPWQTKEESVRLPLVTRLVAASVDIALKSGTIIRDILSAGELGIVQKTGANDLQTQADRSVEQCIMASFRKQFPDVKVIGEEDQEIDPDVDPNWIVSSQSCDVIEQCADFPDDLQDVTANEVTVWVDPLDGTAEYTQGLLDHVTVLIGIAVRGRAVAGVIYQPYYNYEAGPSAKLGRVIWGVLGLGAFGFEQNTPPKGQNIITTTRSHSNRIVSAAVEACEPTEVMRVGGCGHKVLLIIEGKAHAYVFGSPGCKKWDTCAPEAVLHAIGGKLTDIRGNYYQYHAGVQKRNSGGVLATTTADSHSFYASKIPEEVLEELPSDGPAPWQLASQITEKLSRCTGPLLIRLVASAVDIAIKSGEIIRHIWSEGDLGIVEKSGADDLQTQADRSAEQCILASFHKSFPEVKVIGEEGQEIDTDVNPDWIVSSQSRDVIDQAAELPEDLVDVTADDITVWVDPLDGTAEYTQGLLDHVTVLIGVAVKGRAVAGVIYQPFYNYDAGPGAQLGRVIWGISGLGAFGLKQDKPPEGQNIITTIPSHSNRIISAAVEACEPTEVMRVGGCGHKVLLVMEGKAHAYVYASPRCYKWDTCAPEAVLHAIGGKLTDIHGNYYQYHAGVQKRNPGGLLATTTADSHGFYASKMPEEVLEELPSDGPAPWQT